jgi:hypothetical protein
LNGVKVLDLGSDTNDSLDIVLDRIRSNTKLKESSFYRFNVYEGSVTMGIGLYCTSTERLDMSRENEEFKRCFEKGKKYTIFMLEVNDTITVVTFDEKLIPFFIEGRKEFVEWLHKYRFRVEGMIVNKKPFIDVAKFDSNSFSEVEEELNQKTNYVFIVKTKLKI